MSNTISTSSVDVSSYVNEAISTNMSSSSVNMLSESLFLPNLSINISTIDSNSPSEDRWCVRLNCSIARGCAVIDGHGGYLAADIANDKLLDIIINNIEKLTPLQRYESKIVKIINDAFIECDRLILEDAVRLSKLSKLALQKSPNTIIKDFGRSGCCAVVAIVVDSILYVGHVGDCRAVLCQQKEKININETNSRPNKRNKIENVINNERFVDINIHNKELINFEKYVNDNNNNNNSLSFTNIDYLANKFNQQKALNNDEINPILSDKRKLIPDIGGDSFVCDYKDILLTGITTDHCCDVNLECEIIYSLSSDPNPLRQSNNDKRLFGTCAPRRVAGSLAITRALGDGYLKVPELSMDIYRPYCPYISGIPTISYKKISPNDKCIILASDGLWNYITAKECAVVIQEDMNDKNNDHNNITEMVNLNSHHADINQKYIQLIKIIDDNNETNNETNSEISNIIEEDININAGYIHTKEGLIYCENKKGIASKLINTCLENAAESNDISLNELISYPVGGLRREMIDDATCLVMHFN